MHNFVSFNQQISPATDLNLSAISPAALYGKGVFTTIAVYRGNPFLWKKHWFRLRQNAETIGIDLSNFSERSVYAAVSEIITKNELSSGRARLTFFDEKPGQIWSYPSPKTTGMLIITAPLREVPEIKLTLSPYRLNSTSPLAGIKSCNYLENLLAFEEAGSRGFTEAIRLNETGHIAGACLANIFWLKGENVFTPSLETGCLAGTVREFILENFPVTEIKAGLDELEKADGIFLTSAGIGIARADSFGKRALKYADKFFQINSWLRNFTVKNQ